MKNKVAKGIFLTLLTLTLLSCSSSSKGGNKNCGETCKIGQRLEKVNPKAELVYPE